MSIAKSRKNLLMVGLYAMLLAAALALVLTLGSTPRENTPKVGFISSGNISESGWNAINYQGIKAACDALGVELSVRSEVPEMDGSCPQAVDALVEEGAGMIILGSYSHSQEMEGLLANYPQIAFYGASADYTAPNMTSYSSRMYQVRYLSGIVAGMQTKSGKIGFVAADQQNEARRGINAFALGVRRVNPSAQVIVAWTASRDNREIEMSAASKLIEEENVDVITYHENRAYVLEVAEAAGIASIGYYEAVEGLSDLCLTCAVCDWEPLYEGLIREYVQGQGNRLSFDWLGLDSDVVRLTDYSPLVSQETRDEVERAKQEILSGKDVFSGVIYDNEGNQRCGPGEAIGDETLMWNMDWLAEGVRIYEK